MGERSETRQRIVSAAAELLTTQGRDAVTTRSVSAAAGVQPPTIYRLFGDMRGLLDAVAADGFTRYLARKTTQPPSGDPVEDLRSGWNLHIEFGLENPAHYLLMYGQPRAGILTDAAREAQRVLLNLVRRVAEAGRLCVDVERAAGMIHSAGVGVVLSLIEQPVDSRDLTLSERMREAVIAAVTAADPGVPGVPGVSGRSGVGADREPARRAVALRSVLDEAPVKFSRGERILLEELLERLAGA